MKRTPISTAIALATICLIGNGLPANAAADPVDDFDQAIAAAGEAPAAANSAVTLPSSGTTPLVSELGDDVVEFSIPASGGPTRDGLRRVFASKAGSSKVAVEPTSEGFRSLISIDSPTAPERYSFTLGGSVSKLELEEDGSVAALDQNGEMIGAIDTPWAFDADGEAVPTFFEVTGTSLTQVVQHRDGDFAYGITADPNWLWWAKNIAVCVAEVASIAVPGKAAQIAKNLATKAKSSKKAKQAKDAIDDAGGFIKAVKLIATYAKNRGKNMSRTNKLRVERILGSGSAIVVDVLGLGGCWTIYKEVR